MSLECIFIAQRSATLFTIHWSIQSLLHGFKILSDGSPGIDPWTLPDNIKKYYLLF
jgi:hypothetical protein